MLAENEFINNRSESYTDNDASDGSDEHHLQENYYPLAIDDISKTPSENTESVYLNEELLNNDDTKDIDLSFIGEKVGDKKPKKLVIESDNRSHEFKTGNDEKNHAEQPKTSFKTYDQRRNVFFARKKLFEVLKEEAKKESYRLNRSKFQEKSVSVDKNKIALLKNLRRGINSGKRSLVKRKKLDRAPKKQRVRRTSPVKVIDLPAVKKISRSPSEDRISSSETIDILQIESFADFSDSMFQYKIKNKVKVFQCPQPGCSQELPSLSRIKRHYLVHTNLKPFKCINSECTKRFSRKDNMLQHYRTHCDGKKKKKKRT